MKFARYAALPLLWLAINAGGVAQTAASAQSSSEVTRTFHLKNSESTNDANEILTAVRILLPPSIHIFLVTYQNAIIARTTPEQMTQIEQIVDALDRPTLRSEPMLGHPSFRLTYTVSEMDGGKRISLQHFSTVIAEGGQTLLKDGTNVPVRTGYVGGSGTVDTANHSYQFSYLDVGFNFDSSLNSSTHGEQLRAKIEQASAIAEVQDGMQQPIKRQASLELTAYLQLGKPLVLGSMDIPGSSRHVEIEALLEPIR